MLRKTGIRKPRPSAVMRGPTKRVTPNLEQASWIFYQLKRQGLTSMDVAEKAGVTRQMVQRVMYGIGTSARVQKAIAQALNLDEWRDITAARQGAAA